MTAIVLDKAYGYDKTNIVDLPAGSTIDATAASWIVANCKSPPANGCNTGSGMINRFPFNVRRSPGVRLFGGTIHGEVPLDTDWRNTYTDINDGSSCNSKAVSITDCPDAHCHDWRIDKCWDGINTTTGSDGFLIEHCWLSNVRDDAIDNSGRCAGTVRDCLIENVFDGFSLAGSVDASQKEMLVDECLVHHGLAPFEGELTHSAMFKIPAVATSPRLRIRNSVFAITKADHAQQVYLQRAWETTIESVGNYFLNLTDDPLPATYPKSILGGDWTGFTVLQGQAARDYWANVRGAWVDRWNGVVAEPTPEPEPAPMPEDDSTMEPRVAALETDVAALKVTVAELQTALAALDARTVALETQRAELQAWLKTSP